MKPLSKPYKQKDEKFGSKKLINYMILLGKENGIKGLPP